MSILRMRRLSWLVTETEWSLQPPGYLSSREASSEPGHVCGTPLFWAGICSQPFPCPKSLEAMCSALLPTLLQMLNYCPEVQSIVQHMNLPSDSARRAWPS